MSDPATPPEGKRQALAVMEAAVVGLPDRVLGEVVGAVVRVRPGHETSDEELRGHLRTRLAAHKIPVHIDIRHEEFPRNASGKARSSGMPVSKVSRAAV